MTEDEFVDRVLSVKNLAIAKRSDAVDRNDPVQLDRIVAVFDDLIKAAGLFGKGKPEQAITLIDDAEAALGASSVAHN